MNTTSVNSNKTISEVHSVEIWSGLTVQTSVCLVGAALNILNVIVFLGPQFEATPYLYMTALAVADAGTSLAHLPFGIARCDRAIKICTSNTFRHIRAALIYYVTFAGFGLGNILEAISSWITVIMSVERYYTMKWPHLSKIRFTRRQGKWQVIFAVMCAILFHCPIFFVLKISQYEKTNSANGTRRYQATVLTGFGKSWYYYLYTWIRFVVVQLIPVIILCVMNTLILIITWSNYRKQKRYQKPCMKNPNDEGGEQSLVDVPKSSLTVRNGKKKMNSDDGTTELVDVDGEARENNRASPVVEKNSHHSTDATRKHPKKPQRLERYQQANHKLTILLAAVILLFLVGQIPQALAYVHILKLVFPYDRREYVPYASMYRHFSQLLCLITSTANFFLYVSLNWRFRERLSRLCSRP
ncbi:unnamed protein product [Calicophoron daubneyi]|uniref:G-protein coupled receptors family 1 profile domain-containing protein n=1 Tax=Calicophoron daubneyi TaxID=300641 RepID=A0AAV2TE02_CALDB